MSAGGLVARAGKRSRKASILLVAIISLATATLALAGSGTAASAATSCPPIPASQLHTIFGLSQSQVFRNHLIPGDADLYECAAGVWTGSAPTDAQSLLQTGKSGQGALVGIDTWTPNDASPTVKEWTATRYEHLTGGFQFNSVTVPGAFTSAKWPTHRIDPIGSHGYDGVGLKIAVQGSGKGLTLAIGCWWNDLTFSAICIYVEEAASKPIVQHLNEVASLAVGKVLG